MAEKPSADSDLGRYLALAQTGVEMIVPVALGMYLDGRFGWSPWGAAVGAVCGFAGGLTHMLLMLKRAEERRPPQPPRGAK